MERSELVEKVKAVSAGKTGYLEDTVRDILGRLRIKGTLTDSQYNYLEILLGKIESRAAERAAAADCPAGRVKITGEILKSELREGRFGAQWKMLVKTDLGFLIWSTVPKGLANAAKGARVEFTADIEQSKDDPKFGFAKRPVVIRKAA